MCVCVIVYLLIYTDFSFVVAPDTCSFPLTCLHSFIISC